MPLNNLNGTLKAISSSNGISRLVLQSQDKEISLLLLEELSQDLLGKKLEINFKETNVILALKLEGVKNTFYSKILEIQSDTLFARLSLEFLPTKGGIIQALTDLEFVSKNCLKVGDEVCWHIPENEIMLLGIS